MRTYRLFGVDLASDFPFASALTRGEGPADLTFTCGREEAADADVEGLEPAFESPDRAPDGESAARLYRTPGGELLRFPGIADFWLSGASIDCRLLEPGAEELAELRLLGPVLAYWLELRGRPVLHAATVSRGKRAIALLARHGGGKTTLAAALMRQGRPLVSDDLLPLAAGGEGFRCHAGYPQMRMWPEQAAHFLGPVARRLERVLATHEKLRVPVGGAGFGRFDSAERELAALYLIERRPETEPLEILPVSPRDAVVELVRHSFSPRLAAAAGLEPARLDLFARLVGQTPVRRVRYPSGIAHLPAVAAAIEEDAASPAS